MEMPPAIVTGVITILGVLIVLLLTMILSRLDKVEKKLDSVRSAEACDRIRQDCMKYRDTIAKEIVEDKQELWKAFESHSHTGMPEHSRVTRG